ncbi:MAG: hypoxanthine-guanine phosphoribosyltransferase [Burkholderiales bacterium]|jgi:hypoxanthine phosphoribosyltransferase|nr:hypoxanthine-guanine phosphoribosyltransferase [Burkholderiales bacterium]
MALSAAEAWRMLETADEVASEEEVERGIRDVAAQITTGFRDRYPLLLCVMNGAVYFCGRLLPLLRFPLHLDYVHASRYGDEVAGTGLRWRAEPRESVRGRAVIIVDDILDVGETLAAIKAKVLELGAASCHVAVLADKTTGKQKPVTADFVGVRVPDRFVFGCGLDAYGSWRNLPSIYALQEG